LLSFQFRSAFQSRRAVPAVTELFVFPAVTVNFERDPDSVNVKRCSKYIGQKSLSTNVRPRPHQLHCRSNIRLCCHKRQQCRM